MRDFNFEINQLIKSRWSPRAISNESVEKKEILALIEAARYAPSCFNEQPWQFMIPNDESELEELRSVLNEKNKRWATKAPWLVLILSRQNFESNHKKNNWNQFDAGTAWGFLSIEAVHRNLVTHAMAGFDRVKTRELFSIPETFDIIAVVAIGKLGTIKDLDEEFHENESPGLRKPIEEHFVNMSYFKSKE